MSGVGNFHDIRHRRRSSSGIFGDGLSSYPAVERAQAFGESDFRCVTPPW